jgi:F-type H+-transporting ATPase subunit b
VGGPASKAAADAAVAELMAATRQAREGAPAAIPAAVAEAKAAAAAEAQELGRALDAELARAERGIGEARAAAMGALREVASDTATLVVSRLTGTVPPAERVAQAVGALLAARQG